MKKKNKIKKLIPLVALAALLVVALILIPILFPRDTMELIEQHNIPVYSVAEDSVTGFSWSYEGETYTLTKGESGWIYPGAPELALDQDMVENMLEELYEIKADSTLEDAADLALYGLDDPDCTIKVFTDGGEDQILIGILNGLKSDRYVSNGDGKVYLVNAGLIKPFQYSIAGIAQREEVPYISTAEAVTLTNANGTIAMEYRLVEEESYGWFANEEQLDAAAVQTLLRKISFMDWESCVSYDAEEDALAQFGLETPVAVVTAVEGETTVTLEFGGESGEDAIYVKIGGSSYVYTVSTEDIEGVLSATLESLKPI